MAEGIVIRGGTVVDGSGRPAWRADVRLRGDRIVEVGQGLAALGDEVVDADGALVTPGFVDCHTHYDLEMFWDPSLDPLPGYGITTMVMGNCGFGIAPTRPEVQHQIADLLCFVEELPSSLETAVEWGWPTWSEYFAAARQVPVTVTPFAFTAHNALRATVMGPAAWERTATDDELSSMAALLHDALGSGSLGLSGNWFDTDRQGDLVPCRRSDDRELEALLTVLAAHPGALLQTIIRDDDQRAHVHSRAHRAGVGVLSLGDGTGRGRDGEPGVVYLGGGGVPAQPRLGFESSIATAAVTAWHEMVNGPAERKPTLLADPEWRARARHDWDHPLAEQNAFRPEQLHELILSDPADGPGPVGVSLRDLAAERGQHPSDVLADWVLANGLGSRYTKLTVGRMSAEERDAQDRAFFARSDVVFGGTDAGAHLKMFCGAGSALHLLTHWARDTGQLSVEQAVHFLTLRSTAWFSLHDRGLVAEGKRADLNVFGLDEITLHDLERVTDLPGGDYRFTRASAGLRATFVNGVATVRDGRPTGARPARFESARVAAAG